jgi:hypothetical protein
MTRRAPDPTRDALTRLWDDERLSYEERCVVQWCYPKLGRGRLDSFGRGLYELLAGADMHYVERLETGFPAEVAAFQSWRTGHLRPKIHALGYTELGL